nr:G protein-regulated inducer of neurite outgrowth 2 [Pogona vitticeps]
METNSHQFHAHSHQETLNSVSRNTLGLNYQPLSKSSSSLASIGRMGSREEQNSKYELRKSLSSSACKAQARESDVGSTPSFGSSSTHSEIASTIRTVSSLSPTQSTSKSTNHFLYMDQSPAEGTGARTPVKSSTTENVSSAFGADLKHGSTREELEAAVQRSLSDLTCSCKQHSSASHLETSATYSPMSSNSGYGTSTGNIIFPRMRYGSDSCENDLDFPSHVSQIPSSPRDPNVPTNVFNDGTLAHNVTVFTDPGVYQPAVLASHMPGNNFSHRAMYAQGGIVYSNMSHAMYPSGMMAVHNNTAFPYNMRHQSPMKAEGTIPAYCHSFPIPSVQFIPRLVCSVSESGKVQVHPEYCPSLPSTETVTLPKLVSSVSESGLDAKHIMRCCNVRGGHMLHAHPYVQTRRAEDEMKTTYPVLNRHQDGIHTVMKTKDTWTMTSMNDITQGLPPLFECKDAEVQTLPTKEYKSAATSPFVVAEGHPHVFPEVNLEPEAEGEKSPIREVRWDDEGMTWEVYGAAVDPEVLGMAIQKHLEIQIEQFQAEPGETSRKSPDELSAKQGRKTYFRTMMHCLHPSCCARSSTAME